MHADKWRFVIVLLFQTVNDLGRQLADVGTQQLLGLDGGDLSTKDGYNTYLLKKYPLNTTEATNLFNDPIYGFNNIDNFGRWAGFQPGAPPQKKLILEMEMKTYFGMTDAQVNELMESYAALYESNYKLFMASASIGHYNNSQGIGYWQWALEHVTNDLNPDDP